MTASEGNTISAYEFFKTFPDEQATVQYTETIRWSKGAVCPHCQGKRTARQKVYQYHQC